MRKIALAFLFLLGFTGLALGQVPFFPQTLPASTVLGRLSVSPGPAQAIPFQIFVQQALAASPITINGTSCSIGGSCTLATGVPSINGISSAMTASGGGVTTSGVNIQLSSIASGKVLGNFSGVSGLPTAVSACASSVFCVSNYASFAAAVTAATTAGGGKVFVDSSVSLSSAVVIGSNITIECPNTNVVIGTTSTTLDMLDVTGNNVTIHNCGLAFTGTPGAKTAGVLLNVSGFNIYIDKIHFGPYCFVCMKANSPGIVNLSNIMHDGNISAAPGAGLSGMLDCQSGAVHVSNYSIGASTVGDDYFFGIQNAGCALDMSTFEIITTKLGIVVNPAAGQNAFAFIGNGYFDNCLNDCVLIQPQGGAVGYVAVTNAEIGTIGGSAVVIDQSTGGGAISNVILTGVNGFNYTNNSGFGVNVVGTVGNVQITGSQFGDVGLKFVAGFDLNSGATCSCTVIGNSFRGSTDGIFINATTTTSQIMFNRLNGTGINAGGNGTTYVANNLP